ncbi:MAG: hypothetical protein JST22_19340 [Bacteroidetes bacterium]|nr:hypothetical protein [Bacteroidota bacterium]
MRVIRKRSTAGFILSAMLALVITGAAKAQPYFQHAYGAGLDDAAKGGVLLTDDGGYIAVGESNSYSAGGDFDVYVVKTDPCGKVQWAATYDMSGGFNDFGRKIRQTRDGYIIVGSMENQKSCCPGQESDIFVMEIARDGGVFWAKRYGGYLDDQGTNIRAYNPDDETHDYVVSGYTMSFGNDGKYDALLMRINSTGDVVWGRTYGGTEFDAFHSLIPSADGSGDIVAVGETQSFGLQDQIFFARVNSNGNLVCTGHFGGDGNEAAYDVARFSKDIIGEEVFGIVGYTTQFTGLPTPYLLKVTGCGKCICDRAYFNKPGEEDDGGAFREALVVDEKDLVIAGYYKNRNSAYAGINALLVRVDWDCGRVWSNIYGGDRDDAAWALDAAKSGFILAGYTFSFGSGNSDLYQVGTDVNGKTCKSVDQDFIEDKPSFCMYDLKYCTPRWTTQCNVKVDPRYVDGDKEICNECRLGFEQNGGNEQLGQVRRNSEPAVVRAVNVEAASVPSGAMQQR